VVIDDAHVLTRSDVLDGLDNLICGWQPGLSLILAARSDPLLPLHRYRLAGQMYELRATDLAMTPSEIQEVLTAHHVTLEPRTFDILAARTEGWPAGVRLSAMRMEGTESPADFVSELALDVGSIGEYLVNEVIRRQPEPFRRLLIETSFLDEVTGPLADAITGMTGCGDMLTDPRAGATRSSYRSMPLRCATAIISSSPRSSGTCCSGRRARPSAACTSAPRPGSKRAATLATPSTGPCGPATGSGSPRSWPAAGWRTRSCTGRIYPASVCGLSCRWECPRETDPVRKAEFALANAAIEAVFADADSAARGLGRVPFLNLTRS
jgi:hypothetical protein